MELLEAVTSLLIGTVGPGKREGGREGRGREEGGKREGEGGREREGGR